jgi:NADH-quinone oxidoreductase subunit L
MLAVLLSARSPLDTLSPTFMSGLTLFLPALAALMVLTFTVDSRRATAVIAIIGSLAMAVSAVLLAAIEVIHPAHLEHNATFVQFFTGQAGAAGEFTLQWGVLADPLAAVMLVPLAIVNLAAILYGLDAMRRDDSFIRLTVTLLLFTFAMAGVVVSTNYFELFLFWELLTVAAYLTIGHWWRLQSAIAAARRAFLYTAAGDLLLLVGIAYIFFRFQDLNFGHLSLAYAGGKVSANGLLIMALLVLGAVAGKAAQVPLHGWFPDAVEAPAHGSALLYSVTMGAAGVYLVARTYDLFHASPRALTAVVVVGAVTAVAGAIWALAEDHLKRLLAYATMGNLGLCLLALGIGGYAAGLFQLFTSAFALALLVLGAGAVSTALRTDSLREMGGLWRRMPLTGWTMLIGAAALAGIPPLGGWVSRAIVWSRALGQAGSLPVVVTALATALMSVVLFRFFFRAFLGETAHRRRFDPGRIEDPGQRMRGALVLLAIPTVLAGWWGLDLGGKSFLAAVRFPGLKTQHLDATGLGLQAIAAIAGVGIAWGLRLALRGRSPGRLNAALAHGFYIADAIDLVANTAVRWGSRALVWIDRHVLDGATVSAGDAIALAARLPGRLRAARPQQAAFGVIVGALLIVALAALVAARAFKVIG